MLAISKADKTSFLIPDSLSRRPADKAACVREQNGYSSWNVLAAKTLQARFFNMSWAYSNLEKHPNSADKEVQTTSFAGHIADICVRRA